MSCLPDLPQISSPSQFSLPHTHIPTLKSHTRMKDPYLLMANSINPEMEWDNFTKLQETGWSKSHLVTSWDKDFVIARQLCSLVSTNGFIFSFWALWNVGLWTAITICFVSFCQLCNVLVGCKNITYAKQNCVTSMRGHTIHIQLWASNLEHGCKAKILLEKK